MRAIWFVPLLLCVIISSVNTAAPWCNYAGCTSCNAQNVCIACSRGWSLESTSSICFMCGTGCDKCSFTPIGNQQWRSKCTGSCQNGCITCNADYTCAKCPKAYGLYNGQCTSCGDSCDRCDVFQESWAGDLTLIKCTGYCAGGCSSCAGDGLTCNECQKGYVLVEGKCWPCPTGCNKCIAGQRDMFYRGWGTSCVDAFQPIDLTPTTKPDPTPTPTPTPTSTPTPTPTSIPSTKPTNTSNSEGTPVRIFIIAGVVSLALAAIFVIKRNMKSKRDNIKQDYAHAMAAEKQRQAALNIPTPNYQYQPPQAQGYNQGYPQGNQQAYTRF